MTSKGVKVSIASLKSVYFLQSHHSLSRLFGGFIQWKMSPNDELSSATSSSCDVESLPLAVEGEGSLKSIRSFRAIESGRGRRRRDGERRGRRRWYTLCDLRISIRKQGNSLKLLNYKSAMPSM